MVRRHGISAATYYGKSKNGGAGVTKLERLRELSAAGATPRGVIPGTMPNGAVEWIRTTDLLITNQLLYQLSYNSPER